MHRIKELRVEKGLTQKEFAKKIGSTDKNIWAYENKAAMPPIDVLVTIANTFGVTTDYLLGREDDFGNINIYPQTNDVNSLSADEQRLIDLIRKKPPHNATDWMAMYVDLPLYMQEKIFAELKGMHLGYMVSKAEKNKKDESV